MTATSISMAAVVGCATAQPVGTVAQPPHDREPVADAAVSPDADQGSSAPLPEEHTVGTTARPPDKK